MFGTFSTHCIGAARNHIYQGNVFGARAVSIRCFDGSVDARPDEQECMGPEELPWLSESRQGMKHHCLSLQSESRQGMKHQSDRIDAIHTKNTTNEEAEKSDVC